MGKPRPGWTGPQVPALAGTVFFRTCPVRALVLSHCFVLQRPFLPPSLSLGLSRPDGPAGTRAVVSMESVQPWEELAHAWGPVETRPRVGLGLTRPWHRHGTLARTSDPRGPTDRLGWGHTHPAGPWGWGPHPGMPLSPPGAGTGAWGRQQREAGASDSQPALSWDHGQPPAEQMSHGGAQDGQGPRR